jgi:hypothetical protein
MLAKAGKILNYMKWLESPQLILYASISEFVIVTSDKLLGITAMCVYQLTLTGVKYDPIT